MSHDAYSIGGGRFQCVIPNDDSEIKVEAGDPLLAVKAAQAALASAQLEKARRASPAAKVDEHGALLEIP